MIRRTLLTASLAALTLGVAFAQAPAPAPAPAPAQGAAPAPAPAPAPDAAAAGDAGAGERVFNTQCRACHQVGPTARNGVGPQLNGVFGRTAGSLQGFNFSDAYRRPDVVSKVWAPDNFRVYIRNPREVTPGTRMVYNGLRDETQISNLIAYLQQFDAAGQRRQ